jgi:hypothetical protein
VTLIVDGKEMGTFELSPLSWNWEKPWAWEKISFVVTPDEHRKSVSILEFIFSQFRRPEDENDHRRPLAVLFESITLSEPDSEK